MNIDLMKCVICGSEDISKLGLDLYLKINGKIQHLCDDCLKSSTRVCICDKEGHPEKVQVKYLDYCFYYDISTIKRDFFKLLSHYDGTYYVFLSCGACKLNSTCFDYYDKFSINACVYNLFKIDDLYYAVVFQGNSYENSYENNNVNFVEI